LPLALRDHDALGAQQAVQDAALVQRGQAAQQGAQDRAQLGEADRAALGGALGQGLPFDVLARQIDPTVVQLARLVDVGEPGVAQLAEHARRGQQARSRRPRAVLLAEHLHGGALGVAVAGRKSLRHVGRAQRFAREPLDQAEAAHLAAVRQLVFLGRRHGRLAHVGAGAMHGQPDRVREGEQRVVGRAALDQRAREGALRVGAAHFRRCQPEQLVAQGHHALQLEQSLELPLQELCRHHGQPHRDVKPGAAWVREQKPG
jgi:hypothetical protein